MTHGAPPRPSANGCNPREATVAEGLEWSNLRAHVGWSIRDMEAATGINRGTLSMIENGRLAPTLRQARTILDAYDRAVHIAGEKTR